MSHTNGTSVLGPSHNGQSAARISGKRRIGPATESRERPVRGKKLPVVPAVPRAWWHALKGGAGFCVVLLLFAAWNESATAGRSPAGGSPASSESFDVLPATALQLRSGEATWPLLSMGPARKSGDLVSATEAATGKGPVAAAAENAQPSDPRSRSSTDPAGVGPGRRSQAAASASRVVSSNRALPIRAERSSHDDVGSRAETKRRTSVAVAMLEEKLTKTAAPKARVRVKDAAVAQQFKPAYPAAAIAAQTSGFVRCKVRISTSGRVEQVTIERSEPAGLFDKSVEDTVRTWRFSPARDQDGGALESTEYLEFQFKMEGSS